VAQADVIIVYFDKLVPCAGCVRKVIEIEEDIPKKCIKHFGSCNKSPEVDMKHTQTNHKAQRQSSNLWNGQAKFTYSSSNRVFHNESNQTHKLIRTVEEKQMDETHTKRGIRTF
jgi:hypothetical protein